MVPLTAEDRCLMKWLKLKGVGILGKRCQKFLQKWTKTAVNELIKKLYKNCSTDWQSGSSHLRSAETPGNIWHRRRAHWQSESTISVHKKVDRHCSGLQNIVQFCLVSLTNIFSTGRICEVLNAVIKTVFYCYICPFDYDYLELFKQRELTYYVEFSNKFCSVSCSWIRFCSKK